MRAQTFITLGIGALGLFAAGCGGSDLTGSDSSSTSTNASAMGIWSGTDSASNLTLLAFINSAGQADFIRADGVQYVGTVQITGSTMALTVGGYASFGTAFSGGTSGYGVGTFDGAVVTGTSISGTLTFTPTGGSTGSSNWALSYSTLNAVAASLGTISGNYTSAAASAGGTDPMDNAGVSISSAGVIFGQGSSSGCVMNGAVTVAGASDDLYAVTYTLSSCTGTFVNLNGVPFSGMAVLNNTQTPNQVVIGATGQGSDGTYYGLVSALTLD
jgi:hypothetical protein